MSSNGIFRGGDVEVQRARTRDATILRTVEIEDDRDDIDIAPNGTEDDEDPDEVEAVNDDDLVDLTLDDDPATQPGQSVLTIFHNGVLTKKAARLTSAPLFLNGRQLRPHMSVELKPDSEGISDFLTIRSTVRGEKGQRFLRGLRSRRCEHLPFFPDEPNSLCLMLDKSSNKAEDIFEQGLVDVPLEDVKQIREIRFTSEAFVHERAAPTTSASNPIFMNRYMYVEVDVSHSKLAKPTIPANPLEPTISRKLPPEGFLRRLLAIEIAHDGRTVQRAADNHVPPDIRLRPYLTYGSLCCGCGGDCAGARMVDGYRPVFAADYDRAAVYTFMHNFPHVKVLKKNLLYPTRRSVNRLDHMHSSWPCPYWSPAHTRPGKNDEYNRRILFVNYDRLKEFDPIYHTMENTSGLLTNHPAYCAMALSDVLRAGYQVRWKICQFKDYGLPASRNRLVIFAAKYGYPLPQLPTPTHGPGRQPYTTVRDAISKISPSATLHRGFIKPYDQDQRRSAWDADTQARCITTGINYAHPSGKRPFTPRELANLQGFPQTFQFTSTRNLKHFSKGQGLTDLRRQIGNAVPPKVWAHFCQAIRRTNLVFHQGRIDARGDRFVDAWQPWVPTRKKRAAPSSTVAYARSEKRARLTEPTEVQRLPLERFLGSGTKHINPTLSRKRGQQATPQTGTKSRSCSTDILCKLNTVKSSPRAMKPPSLYESSPSPTESRFSLYEPSSSPRESRSTSPSDTSPSPRESRHCSVSGRNAGARPQSPVILVRASAGPPCPVVCDNSDQDATQSLRG